MAGRKQTKKVTSFDVARLAGVSQPTVSRALRNLPGASRASRDRILAAATKLSYVPSESGRILSTQRTHRVAVVSEQLTNPYYPELVEPIRRHLDAHGLRAVVVVESASGPLGLDALADGSYDGVVLTTTERRSPLPRDLTERRIPHVLINRILDEAESPSYAVDNLAGSFAIADLLAGLGHLKIASLQGPVMTSTGRERAEGLRRRLATHGIRLPRRWVRRVAFTHDDGYRAALDLLREADRPTAIVCGNDVVALGAVSAARHLGIQVPADLTVIGFDDIALAAWPLVQLTTVHSDLDHLARLAIEGLTQQITGSRVAPHITRVPVALVQRGTHGPPS